MRHLILFIILLSYIGSTAQNAVPEISNLSAEINYTEGKILINYDVSDNEESEVDIRLFISANGGEGFNVNTASATGDIGSAITTGSGKQIVWEFGDDLHGGGNYLIKVVADDRYEINIQDIVDIVSMSNLEEDLNFVTGIRHRTANPNHLQAVRDNFESRIDNSGLHKEIHEFQLSNYTGQNFIARHSGHAQDSSVIIIDAHYDTVSDSPGADDNGTGTVGVWEAMRVLSGFNFKKTIKFINFDLEEAGTAGSLAYTTQNLKAFENYEGVLNFEMIGYYSEEPNSQTIPFGFNYIFPDAVAQIEANDNRGDFIINISNETSVPLMQDFADAAALYVPELTVINLPAPGDATGPLSDLRRSDHASFWNVEIKALMITDGANFRNPNYHTPNDTIGSINFDVMTNVVKATIATAATLAEPSHSSEAVVALDIISNIDQANCNFRISPNPASDKITIETGSCNFDNMHVELFDLRGELVQRQYIHNGTPMTIPIENINAGLYLLNIYDKNRSFIEKIVIR